MPKQSTVISYLIIITDDIGALQFECLFLVAKYDGIVVTKYSFPLGRINSSYTL